MDAPRTTRTADGAEGQEQVRPQRNTGSLWVSLAQSNAGLTDQPRRSAKTAETVAARIVHDIVSRSLSPGDMLPSEAAMLNLYRVSRASLREALRLLEVQGLVRLKPGPGGGPMVVPVDSRELARMTSLYLHLGGANYSELFEAQLTVAPIAAARAARNPDRQLVREQMEPFLTEHQPTAGDEYWTVTNSFHGTVEELGGNRVIELISRLVGQMWHEHVVTRMDTSHLREAIHAEHREIGRAIIAGQANKASRLMYEHFEQLQGEYRKHWPARFEELIEWL